MSASRNGVTAAPRTPAALAAASAASVASFTSSAGSALAAAEVIEWSRRNMANYKVPRSVEFLEALPLNAAGKVLKTALREHLDRVTRPPA